MAGLSGAGGGGGGSAIRAGRAFVEMSLSAAGLQAGLRAAEVRAKRFGSNLLKIGGAIGGAGAAILAPLGAMFGELLSHYDDAAKAAERLGTSTEVFSSLSYAAGQSGASVEDLEAGLSKMQVTLAEAASGGKEAADALKELGIGASELVGLPLDEQLQRIAEGLNSIGNAEQRMALTRKVFGKGGASLTPLLKGGAAGIAELQQRAGLTGATIAQKDAEDAVRIGDALADVWTSLKSILRAVAGAFLPLLPAILATTEAIIGGVKSIREFIQANGALIIMLAAGAAGLVALGGAVAGAGVLFSLAGSAIGGMATILGAVLSPVGIAVIAITALAAGLAYLWSTTADGQGALAQLRGGLGELVQTLSSAFAGISDALAVGDLALAGKIAFTALNLEFTKMLAFWTDRWNAFKGFFVDGWHDAVKLLKLAINDAATWMQQVFTHLGQGIRSAIGESLTSVLKWGLEKYIKFLEFTNVLGANNAQLLAARSLMDGLALSPEDVTAKLAKAEEDRKKRAAEIEKEASDAQAARDKARGADRLALDEKIKRLEKELADLNDQAAEDAWQKLLFDATAPDKLAKGAAAAAQVATETRGMFGGANARQAFAFGSKSGVAEKTLSATEKVAENTEKMANRLDDLDGVAFA